jgi:GTPase SAR1 family protein
MTDIDVYINPTLNIGILGCISSGKSTLMNSLFSETYSDMKIKKTTMCPQVYKTDKKLTKNKTYANAIRKQNEAINKKLYEEGTYNKCEEVIYNVFPIPDIFDKLKHGKSIEYKLYDIPGLNDSVTKTKFYDYIKNNFYKFDIVIYNVDINSGLNTTDELDILKLIKQLILDIKTKFNKEVKLMIICNKCDDLTEDDDGNLLGSEEIEEMYKQVCEIVKVNDVNCPIIKYSAAYTYMYRSINTPENIDVEYINKIGIDNFGRVPWSRQSKGKTVTQLWELIKPHLSDSSLQSLVLSGFENLKKNICDKLLMGNLLDIMYSKINFHIAEDDFITKYNFIKNLDNVFKSNDVGIKLLGDLLTKYLSFVNKKYDFNQITDLNHKMAQEYFDILQKLISLELEKKDLKKIHELISVYNTKRATFDIGIIQSSSKNIGLGDIFNILIRVIEKTTDGITMLSKPDVLDKLQKVPIEDFHEMIMYLHKNKMKHSILTDIYASKIINYVNTTQSASMIKNFINKLYFDSGDEFFNWVSCCLNNPVLSGSFDLELYNRTLRKITDFIKFCDLKNIKEEEIDMEEEEEILIPIKKTPKSSKIIMEDTNSDNSSEKSIVSKSKKMTPAKIKDH